jgi:hypothetical protein
LRISDFGLRIETTKRRTLSRDPEGSGDISDCGLKDKDKRQGQVKALDFLRGRDILKTSVALAVFHSKGGVGDERGPPRRVGSALLR